VPGPVITEGFGARTFNRPRRSGTGAIEPIAASLRLVMGDPFALALVQAAPDADRLVDRQGVIETWTPNHTGGADRLCLELAFETFVSVLGTLWWKENLCMGSATGRSQLP
jgi:hypothetical protein